MITLFAGNLNDYNIIGNIMVGTNYSREYPIL